MAALPSPPRTVGFWGTALFPVNGMIGSGIFALPAVLAAAVGSFAPWLMVIGGVLFMPIALVFAWLATRFTHSGGTVLYGEAAFGRFVGFQAGWARYASAIVTVAANSHVMVSYLAVPFPLLDEAGLREGAVVAIIAATVVINLFGMRGSVGTLGVLTAIKLVPLAGLVVAAGFAGSGAGAPALPEFSQAETVILLTFYAFMGFENVVETAGEMRRPTRDVPLAIVTTVSAVTLLYVAVIWAYLAIAPADGASSGNALAAAGQQAMGDIGALAIVIAAAFSIGANNFASGTALPRLSFGMAERAMLPRWFARIHPRWGTPANAILFYGVAGMAFGLWEGFAVLAAAGTLTRLLTYAIGALALPAIERREGRVVPAHLLVALAALATILFVAAQAEARAWAVLAGLVVAGTALYLIAAREPAAPPS